MARKKSFDIADIVKERTKAGMNQSAYWSRFGVTQSAGSRYEAGRNIPKPLRMLVQLYRAGKITDKDLEGAGK